MGKSEDSEPGANRPGSPMSLTDEDITIVRLDRRSFFSRAVAAGTIAGAAVLTAACPGGTDSDGGGDADVQSTDADQSADSDESTDSDQSTDADESTDAEPQQ